MRKRGKSTSGSETGFWADVRELAELIKLKLAAGHGTRSLAEALKEQIRNGAVHSVEAPELEKGLKKLPPELATLLSTVPPGSQIKMSAEEYRKLTGGQ